MKEQYTSLEIFARFLEYTSKINHSEISCDQTPENIFYLKEILDYFPEAKIINMVRDPRDVLLSQKNKWKRRYFGASSIPFNEVTRSYFNYHPITMSKIWNTVIFSSNNFQNDKRFKTIHFENLLLNSKTVILELCNFYLIIRSNPRVYQYICLQILK